MITAKQITHFLQEDIWTIQTKQIHPWSRAALWVLQRLTITANCFVSNNLQNFAAALTYNCILAFVPVLSIFFALARGFGLGEEIEQRLHEHMSLQANAELNSKVINFVNQYIESTHSGVFLGVGLLFLIFTVISLSSSIETVFNTIWHVPRPRDIYRRIIDYTAVFFLFPILLIVTSGFTIFLTSIADETADYIALSRAMTLIIRLTPVLMTSLCFIGLFKFMPNTRTKWHAVLIPGLLAGFLFQALQFLYFNYQIKLSSYNVIYGSFAALPLFMVWLQLSWYICLGCGQLSYAIQHGDDYIFERDSRNLPRRDHDTLCLLLMRCICLRFSNGDQPYTAQALALETRLPLQLINALLEELVEVHLINELYHNEENAACYQPAMDTGLITANYVIQKIDCHGTGRMAENWSLQNNEWKLFAHSRYQMEMEDGNLPLVTSQYISQQS